MKTKFSLKTTGMILLTSFLLVFSVALFLEFLSLTKKQYLLNKEQDKYSKNIDTLNYLKGFERKSGEINKDIELYRSFLPKEPDEDDVIKELNQIAIRANATFAQIRFEVREVVEGIEEVVRMPFVTTFYGQKDDLMLVLKSVKGTKRYVGLDGFSLKSKMFVNGGYQLEIEGSAYYEGKISEKSRVNKNEQNKGQLFFGKPAG